MEGDVDLGDIVFVHGEVIRSVHRVSASVMADDWAMASKARGLLPVAHKDMNEETRVRQRYVDLIMRPEARQIARTPHRGDDRVAGRAHPSRFRGGDADAADADHGARRACLSPTPDKIPKIAITMTNQLK